MLTFKSRSISSIVPTPASQKADEFKNTAKDLKQEAYIELADRSEVLNSCVIFLLKGAADVVRYKVAAKIIKKYKDLPTKFGIGETLINNGQVSFTPKRSFFGPQASFDTFTYSDRKTTLLILAPTGKYASNKFDSKSSIKYMPTRQIELKDFAEYNQGIINLTQLQQEEAQRWRNVIEGHIQEDMLHYQNKDFETACALQFFYSCLVYRDIAPKAKCIVTLEQKNCKVFITCADDELHDKAQALKQISEFLSSLVTQSFEIVHDHLPGAEHHSHFIQIANTSVLAEAAYKQYFCIQRVHNAPITENNSTISYNYTPYDFSFSHPQAGNTEGGEATQGICIDDQSCSPNSVFDTSGLLALAPLLKPIIKKGSNSPTPVKKASPPPKDLIHAMPSESSTSGFDLAEDSDDDNVSHASDYYGVRKSNSSDSLHRFKRSEFSPKYSKAEFFRDDSEDEEERKSCTSDSLSSEQSFEESSSTLPSTTPYPSPAR